MTLNARLFLVCGAFDAQWNSEMVLPGEIH